jgi:hypothetical protein
MQLETIIPRAAGVAGAVMAGDIIEEIIKPGSGTPTTPRPPSYDAPAVPQSDPGDEDQPAPQPAGVPEASNTPAQEPLTEASLR